MTTTPWQTEERRIYLRDIYFLIFIVILSVGLAELFLVGEDAEPVDRILSYLMVFVPLGAINLLAHYYYRNRRIRAREIARACVSPRGAQSPT